MQRCLRILLGLCALLAATGPTEAGIIIYDNFGPNDTFNSNSGSLIGGASAFIPSMQFTVGESNDINLTSIDFAAWHLSGLNAVVLSLRSDAAGIPGLVLETFNVTGLPDFGDNFSPLTVTSVLNPLLLAGGEYWITMSPGHSSTSAAWNLNSTASSGSRYVSSVNGESGPNPAVVGAFRVEGEFGVTSVPAPASLILWSMGGGLAFVGRKLRRGRKAANAEQAA